MKACILFLTVLIVATTHASETLETAFGKIDIKSCVTCKNDIYGNAYVVTLNGNAINGSEGENLKLERSYKLSDSSFLVTSMDCPLSEKNRLFRFISITKTGAKVSALVGNKKSIKCALIKSAEKSGNSVRVILTTGEKVEYQASKITVID